MTRPPLTLHRLRDLALAAALALPAACSDLWTAPPFPGAAPPLAFAVSVTDPTAGSHKVTLNGDTLVVVRAFGTKPDSTATSRVAADSTDWQTFWRSADAAGVRSWPALCGKRDSVAVGPSYDVSILYGDSLHVRSVGLNAYPRRDGTCDKAATAEYQALMAAVTALIGQTYP